MSAWNSLYIYYISGTGNARLSSQWIADEAKKHGLKAVVRQIDRLENITMPPADEEPLMGFVFPTHGFNAAPIMHLALGLRPVNNLVRFTSLTTWPFWRRYKYLIDNKKIGYLNQ